MGRDYTGRLTADVKTMSKGSKVSLLFIGIVFMMVAIITPLVVLISKSAQGDVSYGDFIYQYNIKDGNVYYDIKKYIGYRTDNVVIPSEYNGAPVVGILKNAFSGTNNETHRNIKNITFDDSTFGGVHRIDEGAFVGLKSLRRLTLPESITTLSKGAFKDCVINGDVVVEDIGSFFKNDNGIVYSQLSISSGAFQNCSASGQLIVNRASGGVVPSEVLHAFGYLGTKKCVLNEGVNVFNLGTGSFASFTNLTELTVYANQTPNAQNQFAQTNLEMSACTNLKTINILKGNYSKVEAGLTQKFVMAPIDTVNLGQGIESVGPLTFSGYNSLKAINATNNEVFDDDGNVIYAKGIDFDINICLYNEINKVNNPTKLKNDKKIYITSANDEVKLTISHEPFVNGAPTNTTKEITGRFMKMFEREKIQALNIGSTVESLADDALSGVFAENKDNYELNFKLNNLGGCSINSVSNNMFSSLSPTAHLNAQSIMKVAVTGPEETPSSTNSTVYTQFNTSGGAYFMRKSYNGQGALGNVSYNIVFDSNESYVTAMHAVDASTLGFVANLVLHGQTDAIRNETVYSGTSIEMPTDSNYKINKFTLVGWAQNSDGSGTRYLVEDIENDTIVFKVGEWNVLEDIGGTKTVRMYALWQQKHYFVVNFDAGFDPEVIARRDAGNGMSKYYVAYLEYPYFEIENRGGATALTGNADAGAIIKDNGENVFVNHLPEVYQSGYSFKGWRTAPNGNGDLVTVSTIFDNSVTLYAHFDKINYDIIYHASQAGEATKLQSYTYTDTDFRLKTAEELAIARPLGKEYYQWETNPAIDESIHDHYIFNYSDINGANGTFYCRIWNEGDISIPELLFEYFSKTSPVTEGGDVADFNSSMFKSQTIHLYGNVQDGQYKVTLFSNGGVFETMNTQWAYDGARAETIDGVTFGTAIGSFPNVVKAGYTNTSWNTSSDGTGRNYSASSLLDSENLQLYAQWRENKYTIWFVYGNSGKKEIWDADKRISFATPSALSNATPSELEQPIIIGQKIIKWRINDYEFELGQQVNAETLLKATYNIQPGQGLDHLQAGEIEFEGQNAGHAKIIVVYAVTEKLKYPLKLNAGIGGKFSTLTNGWTYEYDAANNAVIALKQKESEADDRRIPFQTTLGSFAELVSYDGWTFKGWWTNDGTAGDNWGSQVIESSIMPAMDNENTPYVLYAKWESTPYAFNVNTIMQTGPDVAQSQIAGTATFFKKVEGGAPQQIIGTNRNVCLGDKVSVQTSTNIGYMFDGVYAKYATERATCDLTLPNEDNPAKPYQYCKLFLDGENAFEISATFIASFGIQIASEYSFEIISLYKAKEYTLNLIIDKPSGYAGEILGVNYNLGANLGENSAYKPTAQGISTTIVYSKFFNYVKYENEAGEIVYTTINLPTNCISSNGSIGKSWKMGNKTINDDNKVEFGFFQPSLGTTGTESLLMGNEITLHTTFDPYSITINIEKAGGARVESVEGTFAGYVLQENSNEPTNATLTEASGAIIDGLICSGSDISLTLELQTGYVIAEIKKFDGESWQTIAGSGAQANVKTINFEMPSSDVQIVISVDAFTYTVSFNKNSAKAINGQDIGAGAMADQIFVHSKGQALTKNTFGFVGYTFVGWGTSSEDTEITYSDEQVVTFTQTDTSSIALYAIWNCNEYTINYNANGGANSVESQVAISYAQENFALKNNAFTKTGHTFSGWSLKNNPDILGGDILYSGGQFINVYDLVQASCVVNAGTENTKQITLYAIWQVNKHTLELETDNSGQFASSIEGWVVSGDARKATKTQVAYATVLSGLPQPNSTTHNFVGWNTNASGTGTNYTEPRPMPDSNLTLYAQWQVKTYFVELKVNNPSGSTGGALSADNGYVVSGDTKTATKTGVAHNSNIGALSTLTSPNGYVFSKWWVDINSDNIVNEATETFNNSQLSAFTVTQNITAKALYVEETYTIHYYINYADCENNPPDKTETYTITSYTINGPTNTGKTSSGWWVYETCGSWTKDTKLTQNQVVTGAYGVHGNTTIVKLYGTWTLNTYELTLVKGTGISNVTATVSDDVTFKSENTNSVVYEVYYGKQVQINATLNDGYHWLNWTSTAFGDINLKNTQITYNVAENATITANAEVNTYTIAFNNNGGNGTEEPITKSYTGHVPLPGEGNASAGIYRMGYSLLGWAHESGATDATYNKDSTVSAQSIVDTAGKKNNNGATITLYAVWSASQYTLIFNPNYGAGFVDGAQTIASKGVNYDDEIGELSTWTTLPTLAGHTVEFVGWYKEINCLTSVTSGFTINSSYLQINFSAKTASVYAKWIATPNRYEITFNANGEQYGAEATVDGVAGPKVIYVQYGTTDYYVNGNGSETANIPSAVLGKSGYTSTFIGWWTANGTDGNWGKLVFNSARGLMTDNTNSANLTTENKWTITDNNLVLYAQYSTKANQNTNYNVYYMAQGLDGNYTAVNSSPDLKHGETDSTVNITTLKFDNNDENYGVGKFVFKKATATNNINDANITSFTINGDGSSNVYMWYERAENTLTLNLNGGEFTKTRIELSSDGWTINDKSGEPGVIESVSKTYKYGALITLLTAWKSGHNFVEWNTSSEGTGDTFNATTMPGQGINVFAKWQANLYTLTLNPNGGEFDSGAQSLFTSAGWTLNKKPGAPSIVETVSKQYRFGQEYDFNFGAPTISDTNGQSFAFDGWWTADGTGGNWGLQYTQRKGIYNTADDVTLYAKFIVNTWPFLTLEFQGGSREGALSISNMPVKAGTELGILSSYEPTKTGYTLIEWNTSSDGSGTTYNTSSTMPNEALTLYAIWTANELNFADGTIEGLIYETLGESAQFNAATNGTGDYTYTLKSGTLPSGIAFDTTERKFIGKPTSNAGNYSVVIEVTDGGSSKTKEATFTIKVAKFDLANATISPIGTQYYAGAQLTPEITVTAHGQTLDSSNYTVSYGNNNTVGENSGSVTITATEGNINYTGYKTVQFNIEIETYTVTFNCGEHGTFASPNQGQSTIQVSYDYNTLLGSKTLPGINPASGYEHTGWQIGSTIYTTTEINTVSVTSDMTVTAIYQAMQFKLTITPENITEVKLGGLTFNASNGWQKNVYYGTEFSISSMVVVANNGYGNAIVTGNGVNSTNNTFTMPAQDTEITVTATLLEYQLTLDLNGGTTTGQTSKTFKITDEITITKTIPTKAGFTFHHWKVTEGYNQGGWDKISYTATETISGKYGAATLTAEWDENVYGITVNYDTSSNFSSLSTDTGSLSGNVISNLKYLQNANNPANKTTVNITVNMKRGCYITGATAKYNNITSLATGDFSWGRDGYQTSGEELYADIYTLTVTEIKDNITITLTSAMANYSVEFKNYVNGTASASVTPSGFSFNNNSEIINNVPNSLDVPNYHITEFWYSATGEKDSYSTKLAPIEGLNLESVKLADALALRYDAHIAGGGTTSGFDYSDYNTFNIFIVWEPNTYNLEVHKPNGVNAADIEFFYGQTLDHYFPQIDMTIVYGNTYSINRLETGMYNNICVVALKDTTNQILQMSGFDVYVGSVNSANKAGELSCTPYYAIGYDVTFSEYAMDIELTSGNTLFDSMKGKNLVNGSTIILVAKIGQRSTNVNYQIYLQNTTLDNNYTPLSAQTATNVTAGRQVGEFINGLTLPTGSPYGVLAGFELSKMEYYIDGSYTQVNSPLTVSNPIYVYNFDSAHPIKLFFNRKEFNISYYHYDDESGELCGHHEAVPSYWYGVELSHLTIPYKYGYDFLGWSTTPNKNTSGQKIITHLIESEFRALAGDMISTGATIYKDIVPAEITTNTNGLTFYAMWKIQTYTLTFDMGSFNNSGSGIGINHFENGVSPKSGVGLVQQGESSVYSITANIDEEFTVSDLWNIFIDWDFPQKFYAWRNADKTVFYEPDDVLPKPAGNQTVELFATAYIDVCIRYTKDIDYDNFYGPQYEEYGIIDENILGNHISNLVTMYENYPVYVLNSTLDGERFEKFREYNEYGAHVVIPNRDIDETYYIKAEQYLIKPYSDFKLDLLKYSGPYGWLNSSEYTTHIYTGSSIVHGCASLTNNSTNNNTTTFRINTTGLNKNIDMNNESYYSISLYLYGGIPTANLLTVNYKSSVGGATFNVERCLQNSTLTLPSMRSLDGYTPTRWEIRRTGYTNQEISGSWSPNNYSNFIYGSSGDKKIDVYLVYQANTYTFNFYNGTGSGNGSVCATVNADTGTPLTFPSNSLISRSGYRLAGWSVKNSATYNDVRPEGNRTNWTKDDDVDIWRQYDRTNILSSWTVVKPDELEEQQTGDSSYNDKTIHLYPVWQKVYTVSFYSSNSISSGNLIKINSSNPSDSGYYTVCHGDQLSMSQPYLSEDYRFEGWQYYNTGISYSDSIIDVTKAYSSTNIYIYATWEHGHYLTYYTITSDEAGWKGTTKWYPHGATFNKSNVDDWEDGEMSAYFVGWIERSEEYGIPFEYGNEPTYYSSISVTESDITLYACYVSYYIISYYAIDDTGRVEYKFLESTLFKGSAGTDTQIRECPQTTTIHEGSCINGTGWYLNDNFTGKPISKTIETTTQDIILYARYDAVRVRVTINDQTWPVLLNGVEQCSHETGNVYKVISGKNIILNYTKPTGYKKLLITTSKGREYEIVSGVLDGTNQSTGQVSIRAYEGDVITLHPLTDIQYDYYVQVPSTATTYLSQTLSLSGRSIVVAINGHDANVEAGGKRKVYTGAYLGENGYTISMDGKYMSTDGNYSLMLSSCVGNVVDSSFIYGGYTLTEASISLQPASTLIIAESILYSVGNHLCSDLLTAWNYARSSGETIKATDALGGSISNIDGEVTIDILKPHVNGNFTVVASSVYDGAEFNLQGKSITDATLDLGIAMQYSNATITISGYDNVTITSISGGWGGGNSITIISEGVVTFSELLGSGWRFVSQVGDVYTFEY